MLTPIVMAIATTVSPAESSFSSLKGKNGVSKTVRINTNAFIIFILLYYKGFL